MHFNYQNLYFKCKNLLFEKMNVIIKHNDNSSKFGVV